MCVLHRFVRVLSGDYIQNSNIALCVFLVGCDETAILELMLTALSVIMHCVFATTAENIRNKPQAKWHTSKFMACFRSMWCEKSHCISLQAHHGHICKDAIPLVAALAACTSGAKLTALPFIPPLDSPPEPVGRSPDA